MRGTSALSEARCPFIALLHHRKALPSKATLDVSLSNI